jgi:predicted DNA-binding protein
MLMALEKGGQPYLKIRITPEMLEKLDRWKEYSGEGYSTIVRTALLEYLERKMDKIDLRK